MLVAECPRCGRPTPARLASPDVLTCPACGWNGPPEADAAAHLTAARDALVNGDARARQMSAAKRRALTRNDGLVFALVFAACSVPSVAILAAMARDYARWHATSERRGGLVTVALVFAAMWLVGALALRGVRARQRALRAACAATPPVRVGGAARCRLCGADLPATDAVTRCAYCGADNLADPALTRSLDVGRGHDVARWREVLDADARILSRATADANAVLFGAALLVPIAFAFAIGSLTVLVAKIERPVDDDARYVSVATRGGECVGRLPSDATLPIDFGKAFEANGQSRGDDRVARCALPPAVTPP